VTTPALGALLQQLSAKGIRITSQRRAVLEAIEERCDFDAASLLAFVRERNPGIDRATIYRTIALLKRLNLLNVLEFMRCLSDDAVHGRKSLQLTCAGCGAVEKAAASVLERLTSEISSSTGFVMRASRVELSGYCRSCTEQLAASLPATNSPERLQNGVHRTS
jgi:Fur family transcriptional regulator, ferric uptake regulator